MTTAVLGLGAMGARMARRLVDAGHDVTVWNRSRDRVDALATTIDVRSADRAVDAVAHADLVISMVRDDSASYDLWLGDEGALDALPRGAVLVEASTLSPGAARRLGEAAAAREIEMLEAPVIGSRPQAEAGALVSLIGGLDETLERARPRLEAYSGTILPVGAIGTAALVKLAVNGLFAIQVAAYGEIIGLLEATAPDVDACTLLAGLPITSPGLQRVLGLIERRDFAPNFPVELVAKDLAYLESLGATEDLPLSGTAARVFADAASGPLAELDISGIASRYVN